MIHPFRHALRATRRRPGFTALNVAGLALGLACCVAIALYVHGETTVDAQHANADRVVRISQLSTEPGAEALWAWTGGALAEDLATDFPDLTTARVHRQAGTVRAEADPDKRFREEHFVFADSAFFDMFSYEAIRGNAADAIRQPNAVVLTASTAARYFGDTDPIGQELTYGGSLPLTVAAVVADPEPTHLPFDFVAPMAAFKSSLGLPAEAQFGSYWWPSVWTYALLSDGQSAADLQAQMPAFAERHRGNATYLSTLEPLADLHFSEATGAPAPGGSWTLVRVFAAIAIAVLLLACVNVVNLTTAQAATRAREVGVRKAVGAGRWSLAGQFVGETVALCAVSLLVGLGLVALALPPFNALAGTDLSLAPLAHPAAWLGLIGVVVVVGALAGAYPAFVLSGFRPARVLRGAFVGGGGVRLRKALVVVQFTVSIALAAAAVLAFQQLHYLRTAPLGFDQEQVVALRVDGGEWDALRSELAALPKVVGVTGSASKPGFGTGGMLPFETPGRPSERGESERIGLDFVDYDYLDLMDVDVVAGRGFSRDFQGDAGVRTSTEYSHMEGRAFLLNQAAVRSLGWTEEEAVGQPIRFYAYENGTYYTDHRGRVVGVVADYHGDSFESAIEPVALSLTDSPFGNTPAWALVKVRPGEAAGTIAAVRGVWDRVRPDAPFEASFLDADLDARYEQQARLGVVVAFFAGLGVVIACLGLFGLAAFEAAQRRREVGIRKVLGASARQLVGLLSRDFVALVAVAAALAVPIAWWAASRWLDRFAYRIDVGPLPFLAVAVGAVVVALLTVGGLAYRAATADPVRALRAD